MNRELFGRYALLAVAVVLFGLFAGLLPGVYATRANVVSMLSSQSVLLVLTFAVLLPLRSGDFDLSVAATMVFCASVLGVLVAEHQVPLALALPVVGLIGLAVGAVNALLIVRAGVNAFIVTLGAMTVLTGLSLGITGGRVIVGLPPGLLTFGRAKLLGLPLAVYYGWLLALALWYLFEYTPLGRYLLFVGGNRAAAALSGVPVGLTRAAAFVGSAVLSAFAGVLLAAKLGSVDPTVGASFLLPPYAAAFLGTTVVQVGRFNVLGSVVGAYLLTIGITGLLLQGAQPWVSDVFNGGALMAAVTFARLVSRRSSVAVQ